MFDERLIKYEKQFPSISQQTQQIQKVTPTIKKPRGSYTKKEEIKSEVHQYNPKKKSLQLRTSKCQQQDLKKGGLFGKHQPERIKSHSGLTLNEAKFLVEWKQFNTIKPSDSFHPYSLIVQFNPEILLNYFEENDQFIIID